MNVWESIQQKVTDPKYRQVCVNIGEPLGLADDLHQEVVLTLCEKVHSRSASLLSAFENDYFDWYVISTARNLFHYNTGFRNKYRWDITGSVSFTTTDSTDTYDDHEQDDGFDDASDEDDEGNYHTLLQVCSDEFGKVDWYNYELFRLNSIEGNSIREIAALTGIPRTSIHQSIKATREALAARVREKMTAE